MALQYMTRRQFLGNSALGAGGLFLSFHLRAENLAAETTAPVETTLGKVRGKRVNGISRFFGVRYGADTGSHRFQAPRAGDPWAGVADCFAYGNRAPQGTVGLPGAGGNQVKPKGPPKAANAIMQIAMQSQSVGAQSEDCLFLNVYTPEASPVRKRPVMVWLHGGGFALGSGGIPSTDGDELSRFGDVVVVALNHRLNAMGYLYLGDLHDDFADSGNAGHLDIVLALKWVQDNIASFGGDPGNVTIFGQSGGGAKVGAMMGLQSGKGLFHKAIEQSGNYVRGVERENAIRIAELTLKALNISPKDVHKLQSVDAQAVIQASMKAQGGGFGSGRNLAPVIDGRNLPAHPFDPVASDLSKEVPLMIGCARDEGTMFFGLDPAFGYFSAEEIKERFEMEAGDRAGEAFSLYSQRRPDDDPSYWFAAYQSDLMFWSGSMLTAERKSLQQGANAYLYRVDWDTVLDDGVLRATHGADLPFVFRHLDGFGAMNGDGPAQRQLMDLMSQAWINFAHTGDPSQQGLVWQGYDVEKRLTMLFDEKTKLVSDPDSDIRKYWLSQLL